MLLFQDLSDNMLTHVPDALENAKNLLVLNLCKNQYVLCSPCRDYTCFMFYKIRLGDVVNDGLETTQSSSSGFQSLALKCIFVLSTVFVRIQNIPSNLFVKVTDLMHLDISNNNLGEYTVLFFLWLHLV